MGVCVQNSEIMKKVRNTITNPIPDAFSLGKYLIISQIYEYLIVYKKYMMNHALININYSVLQSNDSMYPYA